MELLFSGLFLGLIYWGVISSPKVVVQVCLFIVWALMLGGALYSFIKLLIKMAPKIWSHLIN